MKNILFLVIISSMLFSFSASISEAITISLDPETQLVTIGNDVSVDTVISGLGDNGDPSLSAFDINIGYDSSMLGFNSVDFGTSLMINMGSSDGAYISTPPTLNVSASTGDISSFDFNSQPASFTLFQLNFDALATGTSTLTLSADELLGRWGESLVPDTGFYDASITIQDLESAATVQIPEPAALLLLGGGLAGLGFFRRR